MPINFVVSGSQLTVTINNEQETPYSLYTQVPKFTTTTNNVSFFFADGRFINSLPFTDVLFAGVAFNGTKTELETQLNTTFTVGTVSLTSVLTGYVKSAVNRAIDVTDTILTAIGILEKKTDDNSSVDFYFDETSIKGENTPDNPFRVNTDRKAVSNAAYTATKDDKYIALTSITTSRIWTLPLANSVREGYELLIVDESGLLTTAITLTLQASGTDTINSSSTDIITSAYGIRRLISNGINKWIYDGGVVRLNATQTLTNKALSTGSTIIPSVFLAGAVNRQLFASNVQINNTGNTTENTLLTYTIPAGTMGVNSSLHFHLLLSRTNNGNLMTYKYKLGSTLIVNISTAISSTASSRQFSAIANRNSLTAQIAAGAGAGNSNLLGNSSGTVAPWTIDFSQDVVFTMTVQNANAADTFSIESFQMLIIG